MRAFKFLASGAVGRFSDVQWPQPAQAGPAEWLRVDGPLETCRVGIHACRLPRLVDWIDDELWEVELGGEILPEAEFVVAERGRLVRRIAGWDAEGAASFVAAVRARADGVPASSLAGAYLGDVPALAIGLRPEMTVVGDGAPVPTTHGAIAANLGYVTAFSVALASADYEAVFKAERDWQDAWLIDRLDLAA